MLGTKDLLQKSTANDIRHVIEEENFQIEKSQSKSGLVSDISKEKISDKSKDYLTKRIIKRRFKKNSFFVYVFYGSNISSVFASLKKYKSEDGNTIKNIKKEDNHIQGTHIICEKDLTLTASGELETFERAIPTSFDIDFTKNNLLIRATTQDRANITRRVLSKSGIDISPLDIEGIKKIPETRIKTWHSLANKFLQESGINVKQ